MAADFCITGEVKLNSDPAEKATSKWTVAAGQLIADFAKKAASSLQSVVKSGLDYNAQMESYLTNFKVMLGDEQLAAEKLEEIRRMAASTPFSLSDLTEGTQTLLQFGIAADDTTGVLQRLGDISLGNADKLQTLVRAYGKMSSAQKVTLENVNMMIDAGFNPLNQICDATGESMSALYKRISDGKVSFNELEAAVAAATSEGGQFYNGMLEASQTFNGRLSTLTDNTKALLGALSDSFYSSLSDLLPVANDVVLALTDAFTEGGVPAMMDTAAELLDSFADGLIQKIPDAVSAVSDLLTELLNYLADHQDDIFDSGVQLLENLIIGITDSLPDLITAAANLIARFAAALVSHLPDILKCGAAMLTTLVDGIFYSIENLLEAAYACIAKLIGAWDGSMEEWGHIGENIVRWIISGISNLWGTLTSFVQQKISALINGTTATVSDSIQETVSTKSNTTTDADRQRRQQLHESRVQRSQASTGTTDAAASATAAAAAATSAAKSTKQATADIIKSVSDTTTAVKDGVTTTTETITETLSNGTTQQKQVITSTSRQMVDGVLKDVKTVETVAADGKRTVSQTMETVRDVVGTVTATTTALADGVKTTTQTVTKTLADGTTEQQQVITQTQDKVIDGALRTVETVKTIAADGTEQVAETIKDSAAKTLDGLWSALKDRANEGILGTVDTLWEAVKSGDWVGIGKWAASALYSGLTDREKQQLWDFALSLVDGLNGVLGQGAQGLAQGAASLGQQLFEGITGRFGDVASLAGQLSGTLQDTFAALKGPLGTAAKAISTALSGNLLSAFPTIFAAMGTLVTTVGSAFVAMLESIGAAISATGIGLPVGAMVIAAGVALAVAIAAIAMKLGSSSRSSVKTPNSSSGSGSAVTAPSYSLWDYEKETARPERKPRPSYEINQYIYSKAQTAADLMREARYEQERAVLAGV